MPSWVRIWALQAHPDLIILDLGCRTETVCNSPKNSNASLKPSTTPIIFSSRPSKDPNLRPAAME